MHAPIAERKEYYQVLTRSIRIRILRVSIIPMLLTSDILYWQFHLAYSDKISAHLCEPVPEHTQNIDAFLNDTIREIVGLTAQMSRYNNVTISTRIALARLLSGFCPLKLKAMRKKAPASRSGCP